MRNHHQLNGELPWYVWIPISFFTNFWRAYRKWLHSTVPAVKKVASSLIKWIECSLLIKFHWLRPVIRCSRFELASHTTPTIQYLNPPRNVTEKKSFVGLQNLFRRFFLAFPLIAVPPNVKMERRRPKQLDHLSTEALELLQQNLISAPVLTLSYSYGYLK